MKKYIIIVLMLLVSCGTLGDFGKTTDVRTWMEHVPPSWGEYKIDSVANEVGLTRLYPEASASGCGLSDDDFIKYAMDRIDRKRQFQFIIFIDGKPLVGERCLRKAFIFYLK